jgi:hypothetical protein
MDRREKTPFGGGDLADFSVLPMRAARGSA